MAENPIDPPDELVRQVGDEGTTIASVRGSPVQGDVAVPRGS